MKNNTVLILGGETGLAGQALVNVFTKASWQVHTTNRQDIDFLQSNYAYQLEKCIDIIQPRCIINTIAYTAVDAAEDDQEAAYTLNASVPKTLARIAKSLPSSIIHLSTDFVFNGKQERPYTEEDIPEPLCVYGKTKLLGEQALLEAGLSQCLIARTAWLFGPGRKNFVQTILSKCINSCTLNIVHDQVGSPTYTLDLAALLYELIGANAHGIVHVVNSGQASWCELASEAVKLAYGDCQIQAIPSSSYPQKAKRPAYSELSTELLTSLVGHTPRPWPQALREYVLRNFPPQQA